MNNLLVKKILLENELVTHLEFENYLKESKLAKMNLDDYIVKEKVISSRDLLALEADELGFTFTDNPMSLFEEDVLDYFSEVYARKNKILPLFKEGELLYVATHEPSKFELFEDLTMKTSYDTVAIVAPLPQIESAITRIYSKEDDENSLRDDLGSDVEDVALMGRVESAPIVKLVNSIISAAYNQEASDIHIDPEENVSIVRFRVDGQLSEYMRIKRDSHDPVTTRIKIIASMNIAEKRVPQDGAFNLTLNDMRIDMRVATIPTQYGEKVVMRILGNEKSIDYKIDTLDMTPAMRNYLKSLVQIPNGIILITGPTGSGKTTTLYSMLSEIATPEKSVITIEDPVEKHFHGISQVNINSKAGLTFAKGLRSILRLDPDVIMIGEIRDSETASIAIRSAITGHLVLSSLHTNDALSAVTRLIDMGTESYMVASSVKSVIAQRLLRKNCAYCKKEVQTTYEDQLLLQDTNITSYFKGTGCVRCDDTGYRGRIAAFEAIPVNQKLQTMIAEEASYENMFDYVKSQNIPLLRDDIIRLLKGGDTTIDEARKVLFSNELFND